MEIKKSLEPAMSHRRQNAKAGATPIVLWECADAKTAATLTAKAARGFGASAAYL
jgi:hypothetical protein